MNHRLTKKQLERHEQEVRRQVKADKTKAAAANNAGVRPPGYLRRNGLPLGLLIGGIGLFASRYFWLGVSLFLVGAILLAIDVWNEVVFPKRNKLSKIIFGIGCALASVPFAVWLFLPVPFELSVKSTVPQYGSGSNVYGILWSDVYSRLDFTLKNSSDVDYDNLDAEISTDLTFEGLKQTDGIATCTIAPATKALRPTSQRVVGGIPVGPHTMIGGVPVGPVDTNPTQYTIIAKGGHGELLFSGDTAVKYRIRCDKLPANSEDSFVAALSVMNPFIGDKPPEPLRAAARLPVWCTVKARFSQLGRPRSVTIPECKMGQYCKP
jgi:hypothetical protein